ncbi:hypothetical protein OKJ99_07315 [Streptomyces endophyticus]|uniref:Uncharacterized protein n=1 Tax=Streptomyces endophyticus TaxID=714166 RepID=A0ABU6F132_9ACTN|nr:hypothetical protein [Streptomyces endophyticus]MEB8337322.1 hypothetical protein [Streptomyces endophyticus]
MAQRPRAAAHHDARLPARWAAFSCVLVPLVLVWYGSSAAGAGGAALGLAAITAACRMLLRQSERGAAQLHSEQCRAHRGRHGGTGPDAPSGERRAGWDTPVG